MRKRRKCALVLSGTFFAVSIIISIFTWQRYQIGKTPLQLVEDLAITESAISTEIILPTETPAPTPKPEDAIYTFLQGPKSWKEKRPWSGYWGNTYMNGGLFGGFGCGFCCMANIYSSLTPHECSPVNIYDYTKKHTDYGGGSAVAWEYMEYTLEKIGFKVKLGNKPKKYEAFQKEIAKSQSAIVLVCSFNDDSYWKDTPGHYVTIFLYDSATDKVFLADSGEPKRNRHWIPLKKVFQALKTSSTKQYLSVYSYRETADQWKNKKASGNWVH